MRKPLPRPDKHFIAIPNEFFDVWLTEVDPSELVLLFFIMRKTLGWNKEEDWISLSQFEDGTGLSRNTVIDHLRILVDKGMIFKREGSKDDMGKFYYRLNIEVGGCKICTTKLSKVVQKLTNAGSKIEQTINNTTIDSKPLVSFNSNVWIKDSFCVKYRNATGSDYKIQYGKDNKIAQRLLKQCDGVNVTDLKTAVDNLNTLTDHFFNWWKSDKFFSSKPPDLNLFTSRVNNVIFFSQNAKTGWEKEL